LRPCGCKKKRTPEVQTTMARQGPDSGRLLGSGLCARIDKIWLLQRLKIDCGEIGDERDMLDYILGGFVLLTIAVFVLAYWPKTAPAARSPEPELSPSPSREVRVVPAERRVALVIGNGAYTAIRPLVNPVNDAVALAGALSRIGFEVVQQHDLGIVQMRRALRDFEDKASGADWALLYYSGHGLELGGKNWLIPVDAVLRRGSDLPDEAVQAERVLDRLSVASKLRVVIFDACRVNPSVARMTMGKGIVQTVAQGLAPIEPSRGDVVFYAARHGTVAADGPGANSPFAAALAKHMDEDGMELGRFFRKVTSSVLAATKNQQEPFLYGSIPDEDFYFKPPR
jgi:hypothetical protein